MVILMKKKVSLIPEFENVPEGFNLSKENRDMVKVVPSMLEIAGPENVVSQLENIKLGKEDAVTFGSINDVLEDLKVKVAADAKAEGITEGRIENLVENVIKLSKVKNYSYEESLDILAEDKKEKEEALKRIKELEK